MDDEITMHVGFDVKFTGQLKGRYIADPKDFVAVMMDALKECLGTDDSGEVSYSGLVITLP